MSGAIDLINMSISAPGASLSDALDAADSGRPVRLNLVFSQNGSEVKPWGDVVYGDQSGPVGFDFHALLDTNMLGSDGGTHAYMFGIRWDSGGFEVRPYQLATKGETDQMEAVTWSELVDLRDDGELVPGMRYRITDFVTTVDQTDCQSAGHPFDIIVTAISSNALDENARAALPSNGDDYFDAREFHVQAYRD